MSGDAKGGASNARAASPRQVVVVTGMSGAGRTTALNALEDLGFESLDNFPLTLVEPLLSASPGRPVAIGVETRTRGFSARALSGLVDRLRRESSEGVLLVFLDCADETLLARFNETRRRHPLAPGEEPALGIARERDLLADVRARADLVIDTTHLTAQQLRAEVEAHVAPPLPRSLAISVQSFSYKRGPPHDADMVLDLRFLRNPYWQEGLRPLDGRDARIQEFVREDRRFAPFFDRLAELLEMLLPAYGAEGRAYFRIALGCTGGRHRSVAISEMLARRLRESGWKVMLRHREIEAVGPHPGREALS